MPPPASPDDLESLHRAALTAFHEGRFSIAAERFAEAAALAPHHAGLWSNLGNAHLMNGDEDAAILAYRRAIELDPRRPEIHHSLGAALRRRGDPREAARAYAAAIDLGLTSYEAHNDLGVALKEDGRLPEAVIAYRNALSLAPDVAAIHVNLGNALGDQGHLEEAISHYEAALALDPGSAQASYNLFAAVYDDGSPARAEACLRRALEARPTYDAAHFQLAALLALAGDSIAAEPHLARLPPALEHLRTSLAFVLHHRSAQTRIFTDSFRLLDHALAAAAVDGLVLELGVRHGTSINFIASRAHCTVHGFDSFEGLPEAWGGVPKGAYSTEGRLPEVAANVVLHAGWFADSLPPFAAAHPGPVRFMNVDCDLYSSTAEVFAVFGSRLVPGSVVVFDEYLCNPGWEDEEHRALVEAARAYGLAYDYIAFSLFTRQAAIVVRESK